MLLIIVLQKTSNCANSFPKLIDSYCDMKKLLYVNMLQAVLPLRGKILNIERKDEAAMYKSEEIQNLILALGLGVKVSFFHRIFFLCFITVVG